MIQEFVMAKTGFNKHIVQIQVFLLGPKSPFRPMVPLDRREHEFCEN